MKERVRCQGKGISRAGEVPGKGHALWTLTLAGQERPCSVSQLKSASWHMVCRRQAGLLLPVELEQLSCRPGGPGDSTAP